MSAKKRRIKRKVQMLRNLDTTYSRLYSLKSPRRDAKRALRLWYSSIIPLGDAIQHKGYNGWCHLDRSPYGTEILLYNYHERTAR